MRARPTTTLFGLVTLFTLSLQPAWAADTDPIPDVAEALVCGFPALASVINALPSPAGTCVTASDYVSPVFEPTACPDCTSSTVYAIADATLSPAEDVAGIPLPPADIPAQGPYATPPVDQPVGTVVGFRDGQRYCVSVVPEQGNALGQCADVGPAATFLPPLGPLALVHVEPQSAGPTPEVTAGQLGGTPPAHAPATSLDLTVTARWVETRLNQRLGPGLVNYWEPVDADDPDAVQWWADNGDRTTVDLTLVLKADGAPVQTVTVAMPYVGQAVAATERNA